MSKLIKKTLLIATLILVLVLNSHFHFEITQYAQSDSIYVVPTKREPRVLLFAVIGFISAFILFIIIKKRKNKS
ncbi:MAG: hypothetical protein J5I91_04360 [Bacteroidetes bacterium]|nr:hypothetical protein [Bacteroidota bacterium]